MKKKETQLDLNEMQPTNFPTFRIIGAPLGRGVKKIGRGLKKMRRGALILLLILAVAHAGLNIYASVLLNRELAAIRAKGEPLKYLEMAPPPVPEAQNAAPLYRKAYAARQVSDTEYREIYDALGTERPLPKVQKTPSEARVREILEHNQKALSMAREAAARPFCRFNSSWENKMPYAILYPQYGEMTSLGRFLCLQALQEARDGNGAAALENLRAAYRMSDHVTSDAISISFFVSRSISSTADKTLAQVLEVQPQNAVQARAFEASLPSRDWSEDVRRAYLAERAMGIYGFEITAVNPIAGLSGADERLQFSQRASRPLSFLWSPFFKLDEIYALRFWKNRMQSLPPLHVPLKTSPPAPNLQEQAPFYALFTKSLVFEFSRATELRDAAEVARCQRQNALAISAFRAAHNGAYPANLQDAATAWNEPLLPDPYNAKPFTYHSNGKSFTLYSVGPNRADDGGQNQARERTTYRQKPVPTMSDDLVWNYQKSRGS